MPSLSGGDEAIAAAPRPMLPAQMLQHPGSGVVAALVLDYNLAPPPRPVHPEMRPCGDHPSSGGRGCHDWADQQRLHPAYDSAARFGDTSSVRSVPADFVVQRPHAYPGEELEVQSAQLLSDDHAATVERSLAVQEARRMGGPVGAALEHAAHKEALRSTVAASLHGRGRAAALEQQEGPRPSHWGGLLGWATAGRAAGFKVWRHGSDHDADVIGSGGGGSSDGGGMGTSDDFDCSKACDFGLAPGYWRVLKSGQRQWTLFDDVCSLQDLLPAYLQHASLVQPEGATPAAAAAARAEAIAAAAAADAVAAAATAAAAAAEVEMDTADVAEAMGAQGGDNATWADVDPATERAAQRFSHRNRDGDRIGNITVPHVQVGSDGAARVALPELSEYSTTAAGTADDVAQHAQEQLREQQQLDSLERQHSKQQQQHEAHEQQHARRRELSRRRLLLQMRQLWQPPQTYSQWLREPDAAGLSLRRTLVGLGSSWGKRRSWWLRFWWHWKRQRQPRNGQLQRRRLQDSVNGNVSINVKPDTRAALVASSSFESYADAEGDSLSAVNSTDSGGSSDKALVNTEAATVSKDNTTEPGAVETGKTDEVDKPGFKSDVGKQVVEGAGADVQTDVSVEGSELNDTTPEVQVVIDGTAAGNHTVPALNDTAEEVRDVIDGTAAGVPAVPTVKAAQKVQPKPRMADTRWGSLEMLNPLLLPLNSLGADDEPNGPQTSDEGGDGGIGGGESSHGSQLDGNDDRLGVLFLGDSVDRDTLLDVCSLAWGGARVPTWFQVDEECRVEWGHATRCFQCVLPTAILANQMVHSAHPVNPLGPEVPFYLKKSQPAEDRARNAWELFNATHGRGPDLVVVGSAMWDAVMYRQSGLDGGWRPGGLLPEALLRTWRRDLADLLAVVQELAGDQAHVIFRTTAPPMAPPPPGTVNFWNVALPAHVAQLNAAARAAAAEAGVRVVDLALMAASFHGPYWYLKDNLHPAPWFNLEVFNIYLNSYKIW
eukprot:CAMPEP_0206148892 /NCGR_PEP_ID=MMETSP1473-20131121/37494_1 /ASSEMBLY_ACC=CAM_ASM_001109 /TAXON_ID=1461547 /ORGANISM="Stichococcus sp, Strain RCC1054" /LENGTH=999 /DNA_ID=CAMNT_0053546325 /DNA_START=14 /DNA_END=3011 /DNA_ORIENTATION=-